MEKATLMQFLGRRVKIITITNWIYRGRMESIDDSCLTILDVVSGMTVINLVRIAQVEEWRK